MLSVVSHANFGMGKESDSGQTVFLSFVQCRLVSRHRSPPMTQGFSKENQSSNEMAYRFGEFELYPSERLLNRAGTAIPVQPKAFDALHLLVSRAQHLVSKQELIEQLWPNVHVSDANLTNMIVALRKLLGRDAIRTISKHGYRFEMQLVSEPGVARSVYAKFVHARDLIEQRSLEKIQFARDLLLVCLAEDPSFAQGWAWLGRSCWFLDKFALHASANAELADAALRRAFVLNPDLADAHQFATFLQVDTGRADEAVARLLGRLLHHPREPETYGGLVHALRFQGLLQESLQAHRSAAELDPGAATSIAHTLFLTGDFASAIEAYTGRAAYYLDAAAWAALGLRERAVSLLRQRLETTPLSALMTALLNSLLAALKGLPEEAVCWMESADTTREPEILIYFARQYAFLDMPAQAVTALQRARKAGFLCAPDTLQKDPWFSSLRQFHGFDSLLSEAEAQVAAAHSKYAQAPWSIIKCERDV